MTVRSHPMADCDVAVLGAGPYGLAAAAHLRQIKGLEVRVFGRPMEFWRNSMPKGMLLRSAWSASSIAAPHGALSIDAYKLASGNHLAAPVPLRRFIDYGLWFQEQAVPEVDPTQILTVEHDSRIFHLTLSDGKRLTSSRLVVAAGISAFAYQPPEFDQIPSSFASHTSEIADLSRFSGKRVTVIGGGQSALETAALLHEIGATVEVLVRRPDVHWLGWKERIRKLGPISSAFFSPDDVGPAGISWVVASPRLLTGLPRLLQDSLRCISLRPAGARWLVERLRNVRITTGKKVMTASLAGNSLELLLNDGSNRFVDHAVLGTGYRVDVTRYPFLGRELKTKIQVVNGFPKLTSGFESSVPGLHFIGASAAWSFGPLMYFVSGTKYSSQGLFRFIQERARANHS